MTLNQEVNLGIEARQVLDSEVYKQTMTGLRSEVIEQWKACPIRDKEGQVLLLQLAKLTDKFEGLLVGMVESGKFAQHKIKLDAERNESLARQFMRRIA